MSDKDIQPRKATLITNAGPVEVDLSRYPNVSKVWADVESERAKPLDAVDIPPETNEGGKFRFDLISPRDFFRKLGH